MSTGPPVPDEAPRVGVGVLLLRGTQVLLGRRRGAHGAGTWAAPGGHLAFGESAEDCARREVLEETGLTLGELCAGPHVGNLFESVGRHYVTLFMLAAPSGGEPRTMEPDKCEGWSWFDWHDLPSPLFPPLASLRAQGWVPPVADDPLGEEALRDHLQSLERELHHPGDPRSPARLDQLLHPDFHEVGKSGLAYHRARCSLTWRLRTARPTASVTTTASSAWLPTACCSPTARPTRPRTAAACTCFGPRSGVAPTWAGGCVTTRAHRPLETGLPLLRLHADDAPLDGLELMLKGGQMGPTDVFLRLLDGAPSG